MKKIEWPAWMKFADEVRKKVDNMKPTKDGKRERDAIYRHWLDATRDYGYEGTSYDFECLNRRLGRRSMKKAANL